MESVSLSITLAASAQEVYEAWLNGDKHTEMTGGAAECSPTVGSDFLAWDGYIWGENLELEPNKRIVQSWRTSEFDESDEDSRLEITFTQVDGGTRLDLVHTNIPEGQTQYERGWKDHYFEPMMAYFGG